MGKPFQFSLSQLFVAITLLCVGLGELGCVWTSKPSGWNAVAAFAAVGATFGASLGFVFRPPAFFVVFFASIGAFLFPLGLIVYGVIYYFFNDPFGWCHCPLKPPSSAW
jgi:hypothetical protein